MYAAVDTFYDVPSSTCVLPGTTLLKRVHNDDEYSKDVYTYIFETAASDDDYDSCSPYDSNNDYLTLPRDC